MCNILKYIDINYQITILASWKFNHLSACIFLFDDFLLFKGNLSCFLSSFALVMHIRSMYNFCMRSICCLSCFGKIRMNIGSPSLPDRSYVKSLWTFLMQLSQLSIMTSFLFIAVHALSTPSLIASLLEISIDWWTLGLSIHIQPSSPRRCTPFIRLHHSNMICLLC